LEHSVSGSDNDVRVGASDEGLCVVVIVLCDKAVIGFLKIGDSALDSRFHDSSLKDVAIPILLIKMFVEQK
jgi:hypothetical protein